MWHGRAIMGKLCLIYEVLRPDEPYCASFSTAGLHCVGNQVSPLARQSQDSRPASSTDTGQGEKGGGQEGELLFNYCLFEY